MTRAHRSLHRIVWPILAIAVVVGLVLALWLRPPPEPGQAGADPRAGTLERPA